MATLYLWENAPHREHGVADAVYAVVIYPFDIILSTGCAIGTAFKPNEEIQGGAAGALGAILLPGLTLWPDLSIWSNNLDYLEVDEAEFDSVMRACRTHTGMAATANTAYLRRPVVDRVELASGPGLRIDHAILGTHDTID